MARILLATAALAALTASAAASDIGFPPAPAMAPMAAPHFSWAGPYVGINGGGGMIEGISTDSGMYLTGSSGDHGVSEIGGFVGGTVGFNFQSGQAVFGAEADLQWSDLKAENIWNLGTARNTTDWNWFGTVRARGGVAFDRALAYVTAGAAFVDVDYFYGSPGVDPNFVVSHSNVEWGFTAGAGVEYAFAENLTAKFEYLYVGLPTVTEMDYTDTNPVDFRSSAQLARAGVNLKF